MIGYHQKDLKLLRLSKCKSIHSKHINSNNVGPPTYNGFQEDNIGPSIWDKIQVLIGTCCGTLLGTCFGTLLGTCCGAWWELEKQVENSLRTWWEHIENNKNPNNPPPTQNDKIVYWVHAGIPHWLSKISIPNRIPHLIWPKGMNFGWGGGEIVRWILSLWWTWTYPGNLLTMV